MQWLQFGQTIDFFFAITKGIIPRNFTDADYKDIATTCNHSFESDDDLYIEMVK